MEQHEKNEDIPKRLRLMKKFLKQALALVGILIINLALSGCEKFVETDVSAETKSTIQTVSETTVSANQEETQFVTEFEITDWSPNDFCTITCNNIAISIPCKFSEISDKFDKKIVEPNEQFISKLDTVELYLSDEYVGELCYATNNYNIDSDSLIFISLETFEVNGLNEYSSKEDVQKKLGVGNVIDSEYVDAYFVNNTMVMFCYLNNKTSITIAVYEEE